MTNPIQNLKISVFSLKVTGYLNGSQGPATGGPAAGGVALHIYIYIHMYIYMYIYIYIYERLGPLPPAPRWQVPVTRSNTL